MTLFQDYNKFFDARGTSEKFNPFGVGTIGSKDANTATWTNPIGKTIEFNRNTPLSQIYQSDPYAAKAWDTIYGADETFGLVAPSPQEEFRVPTNLFPTTVSNTSSGSSSNSKSGINWDTELAKGLLPGLLASGQNVQDVANGLSDELKAKYESMMRGAMDPNNFQGILNQLSQRGVLSGTVGQDALAQAGRGVASDVANKAFDANIAGAEAKMKVPQILAMLAQLAQETNSQSSSGSSSSSTSINPLAPYELMANMMKPG